MLNNYTREYISETIKKNDFVTITKMMNDGVDVNSMVEPHHTDILLLALLRSGHIFIRRVFDLGFNCKPENGFLYIHHAIRTHDVYKLDLIFKNYLQNNLNVDEVNSNNDNSLHIASKEINIPFSIIEYLTDAGISWEKQNSEGKTPLQVFIEEQQILPLKLLDIIKNNKDLLYIEDQANNSPAKIIESNKNSDIWVLNNKDFLKELANV